ncbi:F-box/LRR-repeat protein 12 isoform X3 [Mauremys reevesii]|uniref:F-box/LRR-repeat protein 12 isoform X3 n=1 Tax=Mauremys reevesii TaxID=260615 RepID=UPI00193FA695|nr:F-box/LRR-repeat protein 12 isoform X3 [Mauremys reevesii]XP_039369798.1 F-box/LRR-repeat protein 12 isoform X3 [Mauremys reevesii]
MDKERLQDELRIFRDTNFLGQKLRSSLTVYVLLALSYLLILILFAVSLSRVSMLSSQLNEMRNELKRNHSSNDFKLFPCGPEAREWEYFSGKCYYFSLRETSWQGAKVLCEEEHSRLAIVNSRAQQNFIMYRTRNQRFWIGLSDENSEGEWKWIDGSDSTTGFTYWKEGEPNNSGQNEDCAHVWTYGEWNDVHCTYECYYICEKPAPPP